MGQSAQRMSKNPNKVYDVGQRGNPLRQEVRGFAWSTPKDDVEKQAREWLASSPTLHEHDVQVLKAPFEYTSRCSLWFESAEKADAWLAKWRQRKKPYPLSWCLPTGKACYVAAHQPPWRRAQNSEIFGWLECLREGLKDQAVFKALWGPGTILGHQVDDKGKSKGMHLEVARLNREFCEMDINWRVLKATWGDDIEPKLKNLHQEQRAAKRNGW